MCWTGGLSAEVTPGAKLCPRHVSCVEPQICWLSTCSDRRAESEEAKAKEESHCQSSMELLQAGAEYTWESEYQFMEEISEKFFLGTRPFSGVANRSLDDKSLLTGSRL
ncbi:hypothetical protein Tco_0246304 [Tanacetum coccineum]